MINLKLLVLFIFSGLCFTSHAQIILTDDWENTYLEEVIQILPIDNLNQLPETAVLSGSFDNKFKKFDLSFLAGSEHYNWLKLDIENPTSKEKAVFFGTTRFEYYKFWVRDNVGISDAKINGQEVPKNEKDISVPGLSFEKVTVPANSSITIYVLSWNKNAVITPQIVVPLILTSERYFNDNYQKPGDYTFLFIGAIAIMMIYNVLLFISTRIRTYLIYSAYVFFLGLFALGTIPQFAYPLYGHMDVNLFPIGFHGTAATIFLVLVAKELLNTSRFFPKIDKVLNVIIGIYIFYLFTNVFDIWYNFSVTLNFVAAFATYILIFYTGLRMVLKRNVPATFFFLANLSLFIGVAFLLLSLTGTIPRIVFGIPAISIYQAGAVGELALFSLSLGVRINEIKDLKLKNELEEKKVEEMKGLNSKITSQRDSLEKTLQELEETQTKLIESEKMAAMGQLTAGVAHEINTPVGVSLSAASNLEIETKQVIGKLEENKLTKEDFDEYLYHAKSSSNSLIINLQRASDLVQSFKEIAVDQSTEEKRTFLLDQYFQDIKNSLAGELHKKNVQLILQVPENIGINSFPSAFFQIFTNLIMNSLVHGFEDRDSGIITIIVNPLITKLEISYSDDGKGIANNQLVKVFDPFYTTKRGSGGSGLGLNIVYNLVTQKLKGNIKIESELGNGVRFDIDLPTPKKEYA